MNPFVNTEQPELQEDYEMSLVKSYCKKISDEKQLKRILLDSHPSLRQKVYDLVKPHLSFVPRDYKKLLKHA